MARPRSRPAGELTNDQALRKLFPEPVAKKAKDEAKKAEKPSKEPQPKSDS